jgi:glycosyltransferase involved in cell wall biosynthesis
MQTVKKGQKNRLDVTVYLTVRNEAWRIEDCLSRLHWAAEVIIFDKQSDDNTVEKCRAMGAIVHSVPNSITNDRGKELFHTVGSCEWCMFLTASDLVGVALVKNFEKLLKVKRIEAISLPFAIHYFGASLPLNPFTKSRKTLLIRRQNVAVSTKIHNEIGYTGKNIYKIRHQKGSNFDNVILHLGNEHVIDFINKFPRYLEKELKTASTTDLKSVFKYLIKSIINALILRPSYIFGVTGAVYTTAYLSYVFARFSILLSHHHQRRNPNMYRPYSEIRKLKESNYD